MIRFTAFFLLFVLFVAEILRVYFIRPFPSSQELNAVTLAHFLYNNIMYIRLLVLFVVVVALAVSFSQWTIKQRIFLLITVVLYGVVYYFINFEFLPSKMFDELQNKNFATASPEKNLPGKTILGVTVNGESKAYPIEIISYHHNVEDTLGGEPIIITYCSVCHTGRVYSSLVNGKKNNFHLVGMDHFNAVLEDDETKSWWQQATGIAIAGPLKGESLKEIVSEQMSLSAWLRGHPKSLVLKGDINFQGRYEDFGGIASANIKGILDNREGASWQSKSWVVGIESDAESKAYDWNEILIKKVINDSLNKLPVVVLIEPDNVSYRVWNRKVNNQSLQFVIQNNKLLDTTTNSTWNFDGLCVSGPLEGQQLKPVQASQEFWHSWQRFHPSTSKYNSHRG
jgi:hypothetical protein